MTTTRRSLFRLTVVAIGILMAQVFKRHKIIVKTATDNLEYHRNPSRHDDETSHHDSCFQARKNTMHVSGHLHGTFINVGMPKMGSTSLHKYFCCGNHTSSHWECGKGKGLCADCMKNAAASGLKPLESCGNFQAFMQMDKDSFFPQIELLEQIHNESPNATFLLMFRNTSDWFRSLSHWKSELPDTERGELFSLRLKNANITGLPSGKGGNEVEMSSFFCNHVKNIRTFVQRHPTHTLIELDITSNSTGEQLESLIGINRHCWGASNTNPLLSGTESEKVPNVCLR